MNSSGILRRNNTLPVAPEENVKPTEKGRDLDTERSQVSSV